MKKFFVAVFLGFSLVGFSQNKSGNVDINVTTLPNGANYSPKHVLAIWVEDNAGNFVKTLKVNANKRKQYLYTWNAKTAGNTTDAITGATLSAHTTHSISWDCTNTSGAIVSDGDYTVKIEYTSAHAQGPLTSITFSKTEDKQSLNPPDEIYFKNMKLVYSPPSPPILVDSIILMPDTAVFLMIGEGLQLTAEVYPVDADNKEMTWEIISGENLATLTPDGFLSSKGTQDGEVRLKASAIDGSAISAEVTISLINQILAESVMISSSSLIIDVPEGDVQLSASILPENASLKEIVWKVSEGDTNATIDQSGLLTATGNGNGLVIVRATVNDGSGIFDEADITLSNQGVGIGNALLDQFKVRTYNNMLELTFNPASTARKVQLFSMDGRLLETLSIPAHTNSCPISMENLDGGVFLLKLESGDNFELQKVFHEM